MAEKRRRTTRAPRARPSMVSRFTLGPAAGREPPRRGRVRRLPWRRLALGTLGIVMTAGLAYGAQWLLLGDALRVQDVELTAVQVADPFAIVEAADVAGESLLTLDVDAVAAAVARVPGVRAAHVRREWPQRVVIEVTEHQGWGYWQGGGERRVIDREGRFVDHARPPVTNAPTIAELGAAAEAAPDPDTVHLVDRMLVERVFDVLRVRPRGFVFQRDRGLTVLTDGGPDVLFGDSHNFEFKVATWGALLDRVEEEQLAVREIDLRFGKHVVMR